MKLKYLFAFLIFILNYSNSFAQFNYNNKLETNNGIEISYKVVHANFFDKESPAQLRIKFKNTNQFFAIIKFQIEYSTGMQNRYKSENLEICIPSKGTKAGKPSGLVFELKTNDINIFNSQEAEWEFTQFEVKEIDNCKSFK